MTAKAFVDTNVFVYAAAYNDPDKSAKARALLNQIIKARSGVVSSQVMVEFASTLVNKFGEPAAKVKPLMDMFDRFKVVSPTKEHVLSALDIRDRSKVNYWDALIIAAAISANCSTLYTEDLSHGQSIAGIKIVNPFT